MLPTHALAWFADAIPHRLAWAVGLGGSLIAASSAVTESPGVGTAGVVGMLIGGALSLYKIHIDGRKESLHRGECHDRLATLERRFDRLFDALHPPTPTPPPPAAEKPPASPPPA